MSLQALLNKYSTGKPSVVTVGTFDGVHSGHQSLLQGVVRTAGILSPPALSIVITFKEQPRSFLEHDRSVKYLCTLGERMRLIQSTGINVILPVDFGSSIQMLKPSEFLKLLCDKLTMTDFITGPGATVGKDRAGDTETLAQISRNLGFNIRSISGENHQGLFIDSTTIRTAITNGRVEEAANMLGRNFVLSGTVVKGNGIGTQLGYPTANIHQNDGELPLVVPGDGIYATWAHIAGSTQYMAATSIGVRPTFGGTNQTVEAYLLDYDDDMYGKSINIEFVQRVRDEIKFDSVEELTAQISRDVDATRFLLSD